MNSKIVSTEELLREPPLIVQPPVTGENDDPRPIGYFHVDEVVVDQNVQRSVLQQRLDRMGEWDWTKAETIAVARRSDGKYVVIEGQHRVLKKRQEAPGYYWMSIVPTDYENYAADEARIARGIAGGRASHSAFDKMDLERTAGDLYWQEATNRLLYYGVEMSGSSGGQSTRSISAISAVGAIMHAYDGVPEFSADQSISAGGDLLQDTVAILLDAFGDKDPKDQKGMWERIMLMVVSGALQRHPKLDKLRMAETLARLTPAEWRAESKRHRPGTSALDHLGMQVMYDYSHGKHAKLGW